MTSILNNIQEIHLYPIPFLAYRRKEKHFVYKSSYAAKKLIFKYILLTLYEEK